MSTLREFKNYSINELLEVLVVFGLCSSFLFPPVNLGAIGLYGTTILSIAILIPLLVLYSMLKIKIPLSVFWLFALGVIVLISIFHAALFLNVAPSKSDFLELVKYLQFVPYLLSIPYIKYARSEGKLKALINFGVYLFIFVGFCQLYLISPFVGIFANLYSTDVHIESLYFAKRIFITGSDPNIGGAIAFFLLIFTFYTRGNSNQFVFFFKLISLLILLINTQGRTTIVSGFLSIVVFNLIFNKSRIWYKLLGLLFVFVTAFYILNYSNFEYITKGLEQVRTGDNKSLNVRKMYISRGVDRFYQSPLFGWGTAKTEHSSVIDSEYLLILQRYGLLGLFFFLSWFTYFFFKLWQKNRDDPYKNIMFIYLLFSLSFMTTNNIFSGYQLMSIIILLAIMNFMKQSINYE